MDITVVYPAYNESANIRETLDRSLEALRERFDRFEILIVEDCSKDDTRAIADEYQARFPEEVRVIHNEVNKGQGASLRVGFREAKHELVLHNAMDYPFDLRDLDRMLPLMEDADIVVATRDQRAGYTAYRKLTSKVHVTLLNTLFSLKLSDYNFIQLYRKKVLDSIPVTTHSTAFLAPELLIRAFEAGYRLKQVEVTYHPRLRGVATAGAPKVILTSLRDMLSFWVTKRREKRAK